MDVEEQLAALVELIQRERPDLLPLDRTYASLDRVEDFYRSHLEHGGDAADETVDARVAAYVGATLIAGAGGRWEPPQAPADMGRSSIVGLPHLKRARFYPIDVVRTFKRTRFPGYLADATEVYDIARRRAYLEQLLADADSTVAVLAADVRTLLGEHVVLDGKPDSLVHVEDAFRKLVTINPPRELLRRMVNGAIIYLGQMVQRAADVGWTLSEEPAHADLGQARINGFAPIAAIHNLGPQSPAGILRKLHDALIKARSHR